MVLGRDHRWTEETGTFLGPHEMLRWHACPAKRLLKRFLLVRIPIGSGSENVTVMVVYAHPAKRFLMVRIPIGGGSENVTAMVVYAHLARGKEANHRKQHIFRTVVGLAATEKRDGQWPARASCQGPTKLCGVASDHTVTERQKCGRDAKRGAEERGRKQEARSGVDQGRHGGSTETHRKTEETVQATQQGIHGKGTSAGLLWARRFFDASSEEKSRVFDKVMVVLQQRCMSAKQDGWVGVIWEKRPGRERRRE